ncbi:MAG TPA: sulfurtransferase TusA family protein [Acidisoma sp.]|uniref:sulfurtransferase TusA family protein n=1 Tax=Acidisoma sp. TaxID=1872115 RepID=UPI002C78F178|nr:sulfurtransferase TusA family protein [Acidisoma sp.]HTI01132.1 sulfurtransferase TusA family protein [Acidisoma sp.]
MTVNTSHAAFLDVTADTCPMTFVRTRLALEKLPAGAILRVRLRGAEPRESVPRMAASQGHVILEMIGHESDPEILDILIQRGAKA